MVWYSFSWSPKVIVTPDRLTAELLTVKAEAALPDTPTAAAANVAALPTRATARKKRKCFRSATKCCMFVLCMSGDRDGRKEEGENRNDRSANTLKRACPP